MTFASFDWVMSLRPALVLDDLRRCSSWSARGSRAGVPIVMLSWLLEAQADDDGADDRPSATSGV